MLRGAESAVLLASVRDSLLVLDQLNSGGGAGPAQLVEAQNAVDDAIGALQSLRGGIGATPRWPRSVPSPRSMSQPNWNPSSLAPVQEKSQESESEATFPELNEFNQGAPTANVMSDASTGSFMPRDSSRDE